METIFINEDKIKIMLSKIEMTKYRIDKDFSKDKTESDLIIWDILDDASILTGFDTEKGSFYVQMYPSKDGGCELFVTRITRDNTTFENKTPYPLKESKNTEGIAAKKETEPIMCEKEKIRCRSRLQTQISDFSKRDGKRYIYKFYDFESLLGACKEMSLSEEEISAEAFFDEDFETFYLTVKVDSHHLSEFGGVKCKDLYLYYILERCSLICKDAVSTIANFAR